MSDTLNRILFLQQKAVEAAQMGDDDPDKLLAGLWLHGELAKLHEQGVPDSANVEFMAAVKIMLDDVLPQPIEEKPPGDLWLP